MTSLERSTGRRSQRLQVEAEDAEGHDGRDVDGDGEDVQAIGGPSDS